MIIENPYFENIERAPAELCSLLQQIPQDYIGRAEKKKLSKEEMQILDAARRHCNTHSETLLGGLDAIGSLLFSAADNKDYPPDAGDITRIGALIQAIAIEIKCLHDHAGCFNGALIAQTGSAIFLDQGQ